MIKKNFGKNIKSAKKDKNKKIFSFRESFCKPMFFSPNAPLKYIIFF